MKIAYVGNFTQRHCTENHLAKTLESLGHSIVYLQENGFTSEELGNILEGLTVDLFLFTRTWGETVTLEHLEHLRERKIPSASYHLDLYVGLERKYLHDGKSLAEALQTDPFWRTDFVFTPDGDPASAEIFRSNNVHHYYMKPGVYKPECYITRPHFAEKPIDVLFVGGGARPGDPNAYGHPEWNYRNELIAWLMDNYGDRFTKFGHPQTTVRNEELNQLYADSKIVVGDSVCIGFNHTYYWSDRVYETLGRGGFLIHPYIKGLEEEFTDGEHLVFYEYGNWEQLKEKIDYYLEHSVERETIRRAGHEFVRNNATYTERLSRMLAIIKVQEIGFDNLEAQISDDGTGIPLPTTTHVFTAHADTDKQMQFSYPLRINLGAGSEPTEGWVNVDWLELPEIDVVQNLLETPWSDFEDNCASEIKAIDVLEHMPNFTPDNKSTPIAFVEECWRILQPGGKLTIQVPHYQSPNLWIDPTHVRGYDPKSMNYFDPETDLGKWYGYYSDRKFKVSAEVSRMDDGQFSNVTFTMVKI